ncbi:unnamed protein product [Phytomonas sp. EM1]|nr:unnamed protein product [Phytomonas sp. EM1]|eukprot:CCW64896.1 unnamed protein product [Phytomonas sp. isolate EM1]
MPRLHVWFAGAIAASGVSYVAYWHIYLPRVTFQAAFEEKLEIEKQNLQGVFQRLTQLKVSVEHALSKKSFLSPAVDGHGVGGSGFLHNALPSSSVWATNREKLLFFCELQQVRYLFFSLPYLVKGFLLATRAEAASLLETLNAMERQHCDFLNFRDEALSFGQQITCLICFWVYVIGFRWIPALCWREDTPRRRQFFHQLAKRITSALEIETTLHVDAVENPWALANDGEGREIAQTPLPPDPYLVLNAVHWIEEVGFWACANNPLLLPKEPSDGGNPLSSGLRLLSTPSDSFFRLFGENFTRARPRAVAFPITFAHHWQGCWRRRERGLHSALKIDPPSSREDASEENAARLSEGSPPTSFGYPLTSDLAALEAFLQTTHPSRANPHQNREDHAGTPHSIGKPEGDAFRREKMNPSPPWIPVAVAGLPRLLFVHPSVSRADKRPRPTRSAVYEHLARKQFSESAPGDQILVEASNAMREEMERNENASNASRGGQKETTNALPDHVRASLIEWQQQCSLPSFSKVWWGGVYGGRSRGRGLHYHVGHPTPTEELPSEWIRCAKNAIESAYGE